MIRGMEYTHAQVSTHDQSVDGRMRPFSSIQCRMELCRVASDVKADRAHLRRATKALRLGHALTMTCLDRLARSTCDLLNTHSVITAEKARFRHLGEVWTDTTTVHERPMRTVFGGLAQLDHEVGRVSEGQAPARANDKSLGGPLGCAPCQRREAVQRLDSCKKAHADIGRGCNVSPATILELTA